MDASVLRFQGDEVRALLARRKTKSALELAKKIHKWCGTRKRKLPLLFLLPLLVGCSSNQRFTHVGNQNTYIMFDQKTAQSCWAGPEQKPAEKSEEKSANIPSGEFGEGELTPDEASELGLKSKGDPATANPPHLPFCKDLK